MPELPDITVYTEALRPRVVGRVLESVRVKGPFFVRTFEPAVEAGVGRRVVGVERLGKRVVLVMEGELFYVIHLMIAGRFLWKAGGVGAGVRPGGKIDVAAWGFADGTLVLTEASTKKRASLHVVAGREGLREHTPRGLDVLACAEEQFRERLMMENRTLKRALTTPRLFDGIGNAYSDEILFHAGLSPVKLTRSMEAGEVSRLARATRETLVEWTSRIRKEMGIPEPGAKSKEIGRFPGVGEVTAFREDFMVHGRFGKPCRVCQSPVQRIVHAEHETNYCATCQTGGKVLADRSLSRLLKDDWPRTIEEWERM